MKKRIPAHWKTNTWEQKAQENPLYAIMTTEKMANAPNKGFTEELLTTFFIKGKKLYHEHIKECILNAGFGKHDSYVIEFGCGAGRILNAIKKDGYRCAGIDISNTMLIHCKEIVPNVDQLYLLDIDTYQCSAPSESATCVFSYAVIQHIDKLSLFKKAIDEMCRLLKQGGYLAIQFNCEDLQGPNCTVSGFTKNYETYSEHWLTGDRDPYLTHHQNTWSGVYISMDKMNEYLKEHNVKIIDTYYHNPNKKRAIWAIGIKE